jgi:hypothetical protein
LKVNVLVEVAGFGLKDAVTPLGRPEADKLPLPLNPFWGVMVIVLAPLVPRLMVKLFGEADKLKFAADGSSQSRVPDRPRSSAVRIQRKNRRTHAHFY